MNATAMNPAIRPPIICRSGAIGRDAVSTRTYKNRAEGGVPTSPNGDLGSSTSPKAPGVNYA